MSPEEQRIKIAEACNWEFAGVIALVGPGDARLWWSPGRERMVALKDMPDYPNDLNACAEFESVIAAEGREYKYLQRLHEAAKNDGKICWKVSEADHFACATATAAQRAEAFLKTIEKWDDSK